LDIQERDGSKSDPTSARDSLISAHAVVTTLLCALFALMYLDRINISAAASSIKQQFSLSNTEMGLAFSAFSWTYLASVFFGGWGARKVGARRVLVVSVLLVGSATIATGFIGGLATLFVARLLVGLGEGPVFPASTQAMRNCAADVRLHPRHHSQRLPTGRRARPADRRLYHRALKLAHLVLPSRSRVDRLGVGVAVLLS
jgi:sugar phosphate permease